MSGERSVLFHISHDMTTCITDTSPNRRLDRNSDNCTEVQECKVHQSQHHHRISCETGLVRRQQSLIVALGLTVTLIFHDIQDGPKSN